MEPTKLSIDGSFFETVILCKLLTDELYLATTIEHLQPEYFRDKNKQVVIGIIYDFFIRRGVAPSIPEIKSYLTTPELKESFKAVVSEMQQFSDVKLNQDELYANTEQFLKERAVYHSVLKVIDDCSKNKIDTASVLSTMEKACNITLLHDIGFDYFNKIDQHVTDVTKRELYIPTGWDWLDKKLGGGLAQHGRALYIFAGETNVGKSIFLGNLAANVAAQGRTVVIVTLEMPETLYAKRISAKLSQIPIQEMCKSPDVLREKLYAYRNIHPNSRLIIKEFPPSSITPLHLNAFLKKLVQSGIVPDLLVLDYLNLLTTTVGTNSYEKIKHITEQVRALTYAFKIPAVSATQINRQGVNKEEPGVETVSESMGLPATADAMMSLWQNDEDRELGIIQMSMLKNRFGPNFGTCAMRIDYPTLSLSEDEHTSDTDAVVDTIQTLSNLAKL